MYRFALGEIRNIGIEITSRSGDVFEITNATCKVIRHNETVSTQAATVDGARVLTLFSEDAPGVSVAQFSYTLGAEKFITPVEVEVSG